MFDWNELQIENDVRQALIDLTRRLKDGLGDRLRSVILYGSLLTPQFRSVGSDVNLLIVADPLDFDLLRTCRGFFADWPGARPLSPAFFEPCEVSASADVFPSRFLSILDNYRVVAGEDCFRGVKVQKEHLRLRMEQDLRECQMRLRRQVAQGDPAELEVALLRETSQALQALQSVLRYKGLHVPPTPSAVVEAVGRSFTVDLEPIERALDLRRGDFRPATAQDLETLCRDFMTSLTGLVGQVDQL